MTGYTSRGLRQEFVPLRKMPGLALLLEGTRWCEIDERVKPEPGEPVFGKQAASAFFGTSLISFLLGASVDSLIVTGCVTSGCVRASVVDAVSLGFRTIVPAECVGDRAAGPHDSNIFDMDSKYADVEHWLKINLPRVRDLKLDRSPPKQILDLGCGAGFFLFRRRSRPSLEPVDRRRSRTPPGLGR